MCTEEVSKKTQNAWNTWLDERDQAPNEVISQWFRERAHEGIEAATEYAKSGLQKVASFQDATEYARAGLQKVASFHQATEYARAGLQKLTSFQECGEFEDVPAQRPRRATDSSQTEARIQDLLKELFRLHDLKSNNVLEEEELVKLNQKVALLHYGREGTDKAAIREKYQTIFREHLDPQGRPVPFEIFNEYMKGVVAAVDSALNAQEMMLEQFVAEAQSGREAFRFPSLQSESDVDFLSADELYGKTDPVSQSESSCCSTSSESCAVDTQHLRSPDASPTRICLGLKKGFGLHDDVVLQVEGRPCWKVNVVLQPAAVETPPGQDQPKGMQNSVAQHSNTTAFTQLQPQWQTQTQTLQLHQPCKPQYHFLQERASMGQSTGRYSMVSSPCPQHMCQQPAVQTVFSPNAVQLAVPPTLAWQSQRVSNPQPQEISSRPQLVYHHTSVAYKYTASAFSQHHSDMRWM